MFNVLLALALTAASLSAATMTYSGVFMPVNQSGVSGTVLLTLDGNNLTVQIDATGLEPNQMHPMHIHGRLDAMGNPLPPLPPSDQDGDGFIETPEAEPAIGPPLLPLDSPPGSGNFPTAPGGMLHFLQTYTLTNMLLTELMPLNLRTVEIHGKTTGTEGAGTPFEVNGTPGYKAELPVASAMPALVTESVPEPTTYSLFAAGAVLLGLCRRLFPARQ